MKARERKERKEEQGGREVMLDGDSRKMERAKDRTESGLEEFHGPESSPCISTQYPLLSPKIIEREQEKTTGGKGKTRTQQADVSSGLRLN